MDTRQADVARSELEEMKTLKEASDDRIHMLELNFEELYGQSSVVREEALEFKAQRDAACSELVCVCRQLACVRSLLSIFSAQCSSRTGTRTNTYVMQNGCRREARQCCRQ